MNKNFDTDLIIPDIYMNNENDSNGDGDNSVGDSD
jgi:hypothetical protein